jgi:hypothetical protein
VLTLEKKLEVVAAVHTGKSQRLVADMFASLLLVKYGRTGTKSKRSIVKEPHFGKLDKACYLWFQQQRSKGAPVSRPVLQEKPRQLFSVLYPDEDDSSFKASSGWLLVSRSAGALFTRRVTFSRCFSC